jgi:hypothetical protein
VLIMAAVGTLWLGQAARQAGVLAEVHRTEEVDQPGGPPVLLSGVCVSIVHQSVHYHERGRYSSHETNRSNER